MKQMFGTNQILGSALMSGIKLNRRSLLQGVGMSALTAFTPTTARAQNRTQVLVIGAGLTGLQTTLLLEEQGVDVQIIEGRRRVGGRVFTLDNVPGTPEAGANSLGSGYARVIDAAERYGAEMKPNGQSYLRNLEIVVDDKIVPLAEWPDHQKNPLPKDFKTDTPWGYYTRFMKDHVTLPQAADWLDPAFADLDIAFDDWMLKEGSSTEVIDMICNHKWEYNNSTHEVSTLAVMFSFLWGRQMFQKRDGVRSYVFKGGNMRLPETMASKLKNEIHFGKEVIAIRSGNDGADVTCADGTFYRADRVVSSMPFPVLRKIKVDPYFAGMQRKAIWLLPRKNVTQVHLVPKSPFWEDDGFSPGLHVADAGVSYVMPNFGGDDPNEVTSLAALMFGNEAERADQMDEDSVKAMVIAAIEKIRPAAKGKLEAAGFKSWFRDPFASGDSPTFGPGQVTQFVGEMSAVHGRLHIGGNVTALSANGMEGALESAERVATEVLDVI